MIPAVRFGKIVGQIGHVPVRMVDAELVRHLTKEPDFVVGGHGYIYDFIPKREIWLDQDMSPQAVACSALHEATERTLMRQKKMGYDRAHDFANGVESKMRAELIKQGGLRGEQPLVVAGRWYRRWLTTHMERLAA